MHAILKLLKKYTFPLILKPSDGRGSRGVLFIEKYTDFDWAWEQSLKNSENLARWRASSVECESAETFMLMRKIK